MIWTYERPTEPGLYWYRHDPDAQQDNYEALKVIWDEQHSTWLVRSPESETGLLSKYDGEWYGPISPPAHFPRGWDPTDSKDNARIIVRLRHGGSFYLKKRIPDEIALLLSRKLKALREHGESIPSNLRMKVTDVVRELITFTGLPPTVQK